MQRRKLLITACFACPGAMFLTGCAKKTHVSRRPVSPPPQPQPRNAPPVSRPPEGAAPSPGAEYGIASWYGYPYHGRIAADGEVYDMEQLTAAHRTLPFNTWVRVTNLSNRKYVDVRITDRGPFIEGRIVDLSHAAAQAIDLIGPGTAQVQLAVLSQPALPVAASFFAVQVGSFQNRTRAEVFSRQLERYGATRIVPREGVPLMWRVMVGTEPRVEDAYALRDRLRTEVGSGFVVRLDEMPAANAGGAQ